MIKRSLGIAVLIVALVSLAGCGTLIPKKVEFFQKKVQSVPTKTISQEETEKQAAYAAALSARLTVDAAISNNSPASVIVPAKNTEALASAVSISLGPPQTIVETAVTNLVTRVIENRASLDYRIAKYAAKIDPLVGKKIEGTGFIRVPYFVYIGSIVLLLFLGWTGLKIYGAINPIVGLGTNVVGRVSSRAVADIASQITKGGELFKEEIVQSDLAHDIKGKVLELFAGAHAKVQDKATQDIVKALTVKPTQV